MDEFLAEMTQPLYRFLVRMTRNPDLAADLTQETLLRAWRHRRRLRNASAGRAWILRIAVNLYRDNCRKDRPLAQQRVDWERLPASDPLPEARARQQEMHQRVLTALGTLPQRQREVMHLRLIEQLSPGDIAVVLDLDAGTVRSNLSAARKRLRALLPELVPQTSSQAAPHQRELTAEREAGRSRS